MALSQPVQKTQVQFLGQEDPLEKEMVNPLQYFRLGNPWTEEAGGLQSVGSQEFNRTEHAHTHTHTHTHRISLKVIAVYAFISFLYLIVCGLRGMMLSKVTLFCHLKYLAW